MPEVMRLAPSGRGLGPRGRLWIDASRWMGRKVARAIAR